MSALDTTITESRKEWAVAYSDGKVYDEASEADADEAVAYAERAVLSNPEFAGARKVSRLVQTVVTDWA